MHVRLLTALAVGTALTLSAAAQAQHWGGSHRDSPRFASPPSAGDFSRCRDGNRHHGHRDGRFDCSGFADGWAYADGEWALYNNRSWQSDSYNDWWNDRPDRAFPRWVQEQHARGTCDPDRVWWSGSGWHC